MNYEEAEEFVRKLTDPEELIRDPRLMMKALEMSAALGELAALRTSAYSFHFYEQAEDNFEGLHLVMARVMEGPVKRLEEAVEETIAALAKLTADLDNCQCQTCKQERLLEAAQYN